MPSPIPDDVIRRGLARALALGLLEAWSSERDGGAPENSPRRYYLTWPDGRTEEVGAGYAFAYGRGVHDVLELEGSSWASL